MYEENELKTGRNPLEAALAGLRPVAPAISRDALVFRAGGAVALRQVRRWRAAASTLGVLLVVALILPARPRAPRTVYVEKNVPALVPSSVEPDNTTTAVCSPNALAYLPLRDDVLSRGVDVLPAVMVEPSRAAKAPSEPERAFQPRPSVKRTGYIEKLEKMLELGV